MNRTFTLLVLAAAFAAAWFRPAEAQQALTMFWPGPLTAPDEKVFKDWAGKVTADSKGTLAVDLKSNSPLANFGNIVDRVENNVVQVGIALTSALPGRFELTNVVSVPFTMDLDDDNRAAVALWRVYKQGLLDSEWKTVVPMFVGVSKQAGFHFAKAPASLDHLEGLKMRIFTSGHVPLVEGLGMQPVSLPPADQYQALQRGTIDGDITSWTTFPSYNLAEVTKYHVDLPLGGSAFVVFMSRKQVEQLPPAARSAIEANSNEDFSRAFDHALFEDAQKGRASASGPGQTIVQLTPQKTEEWRKKFGEPMIAQWEQANGPQAPKVLAAFKKAYADVKAGH